jgi:1,4-dihydroxy-2-naphthoyl-CoA hydrolase
MSLWKTKPSLAQINDTGRNTLVEHLDIEFVEVGDDYIKATMPVDHRTHMPLGMLHGGASVALAETLGSVGSFMCLEDLSKEHCVGLEINANHLRPVRDGLVTGIARPIHIGKTTHVWDIVIVDEEEHPVCVSRITLAVVSHQP